MALNYMLAIPAQQINTKYKILVVLVQRQASRILVIFIIRTTSV